jgi:hypothetical protein
MGDNIENNIENIKKEKKIISCPYYLIDFDNSDQQILTQLRELCCDEYYEYMDFIDIEIIKKISYFLGRNVILDLFSSCGSNGSIKAFNFLIKKFNIVIKNDFTFDLQSIEYIYTCVKNSNFILINDKDNKYWKSIFKKYIFDNYNIGENELVKLVKDMIWDKDIKLIKEIYSKLNILSNNNTKSLFEKLKTQLFNVYNQYQYQVAKFLTEFYFNYIDHKEANDIISNIFKYTMGKKYTTKNKIKVLDFIFDYVIVNFSDVNKNDIMNNSLQNCLDLELFEWVERKKINVDIKTWKYILKNMFANNIKSDNLFDIFYFVVKKNMNLNNKINWNDYYSDYKYTYNNKLIKYLIDMGEIQIDLDDFSSNSNYYEYYQTKSTFESRKKYIENYYSDYQKKKILENKSTRQIIL